MLVRSGSCCQILLIDSLCGSVISDFGTQMIMCKDYCGKTCALHRHNLQPNFFSFFQRVGRLLISSCWRSGGWCERRICIGGVGMSQRSDQIVIPATIDLGKHIFGYSYVHPRFRTLLILVREPSSTKTDVFLADFSDGLLKSA